MYRIDSNGAVDGRFQPGNPAIGQKATQLDAAWFNSVQEEICAVIESAGIELDKPTENQLYSAIIALIAGVVGDGSGAVPTTRQVVGAGLATGGGDLAADRTITVQKASSAEVSAQTNDTKAVTPLALAGLVSLTVSGSAWILRLGEVVIQVFTGSAIDGQTTILTLPQAYTTQCRAAWVNGGYQSSTAQDNGPYVNGTGLSTVSVFNALDNTVSVNVIAIGR
jgi:hypothetical protein